MFLPDYSHNIRSGDTLYVRDPDGLKIGVVYKRGDNSYNAYGASGAQVNHGYAYAQELDAVHGVWDHHKRKAALESCVFCDIAKGLSPAQIMREWDDVIAFYPRGGGCTEGHVMVCPRRHVADAGENPDITAQTVYYAAQIMREMPSANMITSKGTASSQTIFHLHVHVAPRRVGDNLPLLWTERTCGCI